ncbi:LysM peptidoglycan-binding domain-containing protein [Lacticaseibacillus rhamnosus]|uniref:LysM peptidoglycan-binding domain-containing protein n=1 Tax=Lacticaseibacillus rhamnosus TaxID=47715 RepID=UPI000235B70C|nr:LysM domain-containing protein [Lacticaseibacillus rhamnosus]EHJ24038.1 peptidase M23 [Lacticaseibacillus rhamnosus R0011]KIX30167.1 peptidase M23B [Lacticaseibacillus rhamnosus]PTS14238.1 LysM peptidoglycan-binding domain-containing protein [Lacticaseibacillus rhamnosus]PTS26864.1 LysM peptidoglycan-binding domain-containing protein [Lacticaseibacillus rhamnosus]PTU96199.1 LysM peptidoglycan-binding domain-containing protein [Lacticaseibacillus rhamnosus]
MAEKDKNQHDNVDQEQHQSEDANKPWETLFDDDRDDQGNLSRVATRKKRQGSSKLTWILAILLILAVLAPIIYYKVMDNQGSSGGNLSNDKVVIQSAKKTSHSSKTKKSAKSSKTSKTSKTSAKEASSSQQATSAQASSQVSQAPSASQNQEQASASAAPSQASTAGNSYTVKSGDNLYRIAVNHNMTLDELLQLNGLSANSGITPGTVLKVK